VGHVRLELGLVLAGSFELATLVLDPLNSLTFSIAMTAWSAKVRRS
jgi:hypothetical protein